MAAGSSSRTLRWIFRLFILLGVVVVVYSALSFAGARQTLAEVDAAAERVRQMSTVQEGAIPSGIAIQTFARKRDATRQETQSIIMGGVGLLVIGAGWLLHDMVESRTAQHAECAN